MFLRATPIKPVDHMQKEDDNVVAGLVEKAWWEREWMSWKGLQILVYETIEDFKWGNNQKRVFRFRSLELFDNIVKITSVKYME